ncbi:5'-3' exonuclease PLD3 isoform X1 [Triplophysa rosa]|nr:5'-3' exonuclease PLD3 isoform X1 [Triplophysa rosa]
MLHFLGYAFPSIVPANLDSMKSDIPYGKMVDVESRKGEAQYNSQKYYRCLIILTCLTTVLLILLSLQTLLVPMATTSSKSHERPLIRETCTDPCRIVLLESIPEGLVFNSSTTHQSIYEAWLNLISAAQSSLDIASFYWTLTNRDTQTHEPTANQGEQILQELGRLSGKVSVRVAVDTPSETKPLDDILFLMNSGADVRMVNMRGLTTGVLHTKFWIVDKKHIYIGSANMDWRSLTQVKELGAVVYDCGCLAEDLGKIFEAYWYLNQTKTVPAHWPSKYSTLYNKDTPMQMLLNGTYSSVYLSSSPPSLCAEGRTPDLQSILSVIGDAQQFVYIAVMNYLPTMEYSKSKRYWTDIDTQLRRVAYERKIRVRLLISCWESTNPIMFPFLRSLASLRENNKLDVQVKIFTVPSNPRQKGIPYARVNHNKYMVTDRVAYIGTSNWSGDYFVNTAGSALLVNQTSAQTTSPTVQEQLQAVFERDWDSSYSREINHNTNHKDVC